jgi:SRSO17 transposase
LKRLDRELTTFVETLTAGLGRQERRTAMSQYITGLLLDGERKSIEPIAARLVERADQIQAMRQRLQQCVVVSPWDAARGRGGLRLLDSRQGAHAARP